MTALLAAPMHGQLKLSREGYRTRDGHLIEWFGRLLEGRGSVDVVSRPEPWMFRFTPGPRTLAPNTRDLASWTARIPDLRERRRWWVDSAGSYHRALADGDAPVVTWNPFLGISNAAPALRRPGRIVAFDLLDDWTVHYAFAGIRDDVRRAYAAMFELADRVTANSEATLDLARRHGRDDAQLLPNGVDPDRFDTVSAATGPLTVGYVGKIGKRVDLDLVLDAARGLPEVRFVFAGPFLDREYHRPLAQQPNIELLGDVHYERVPAVLTRFDLGWVPHRVGEGEVGGDVIKTYEYRAAGLPVLTTPILGAADRGLDSVEVLPAGDHVARLAAYAAAGPRVARRSPAIPVEATWRHKAQHVLTGLGLSA